MTEDVTIEDVIFYVQDRINEWRCLKASVPYSMVCGTLENIIINLEIIREQEIAKNAIDAIREEGVEGAKDEGK